MTTPEELAGMFAPGDDPAREHSRGRAQENCASSRDAGQSEADFHGYRWIEGNPMPLRSGMFCCAKTQPGES
jgi:hypothetical protein